MRKNSVLHSISGGAAVHRCDNRTILDKASRCGPRCDPKVLWTEPRSKLYCGGIGRGTQVVRERSAKPLYVGSIPTRASSLSLHLGCIAGFALKIPKRVSETRGIASPLADHFSLVAGYTFLSDGRWSLTRPSSSHLTSASSSFVCSTEPNSPVGCPKWPTPSTRSPGFSSSVARRSPSGGFLARSESGVAPGYDRGAWGALRSLGIDLVVGGVIFHFHCFFPKRPQQRLHCDVFILNRYSVGS